MKLKKTDAATDGTQEDPLVVAKGMFTGFVPSRASGIEPRVSPSGTIVVSIDVNDPQLYVEASTSPRLPK